MNVRFNPHIVREESVGLLVIDLRPGAFADFTARQTADTVAWLRSGSRIVIGVTDDTDTAGPLDAGMDLLLTADQLDACTHAIRSNPMAAQVLTPRS